MKHLPVLTKLLEGIASISIAQGKIIDPMEGKTDEELLRDDWVTVGNDLKKIYSEVEKEKFHNGEFSKTA